MIGEIYKANDGYTMIVVAYHNSKKVTVRFEDGYQKDFRKEDIKRGQVKNPYAPTSYGKGFTGEGLFTPSIKGKLSHAYKTWRDMLKRCYCPEDLAKRKAYAGCEVSESWLNFQNFAAFHERFYREGFVLDKDILIKGNRLYSGKTCCFVPSAINGSLIRQAPQRGALPIGVIFDKVNRKYVARCRSEGRKIHLGRFNDPMKAFAAYKSAKEQHLINLARDFKKCITAEVFEALTNYKVEIDD